MNKSVNNKEADGPLKLWSRFKTKHPTIVQFIVFFMLSNGVTVFQLLLMPLLKGLFDHTSLVDINFRVFQIGKNFNGSDYYVFDYAAGFITSGGGGGLAYFLAVQITMGIAQVINFFAQRTITFKSSGSIRKAAFWYVAAYIVISIGAAALQGLYKAPIYQLFMINWKMGSMGEMLADIFTMIINCAVSFWVFFPIFKIIFRREEAKKT